MHCLGLTCHACLLLAQPTDCSLHNYLQRTLLSNLQLAQQLARPLLAVSVSLLSPGLPAGTM